jgi:small subunit ribosomal protein S6
MANHVYECLLMLDTSKVSADQAAAISQIEGIFTKHHCELLASRPWDERRLAYPVTGQKKALYYLIYFKTGAENVVAIERDFKLNEVIMRHLVLRIHEKLEETMLTLARDPHALALQAVVEDPNDEFGDFGGGGRDRRPREPREPRESREPRPLEPVAKD